MSNANFDGYLEELGAAVDDEIADDPEATPSEVAAQVCKHIADSYHARPVVEAMAKLGLKRAQAAIDEAAAEAEDEAERAQEEADMEATYKTLGPEL